MGMDLHGNNPITEEGEYFRNNIWSWGPLADYIKQVAPDLASLGKRPKCCVAAKYRDVP